MTPAAAERQKNRVRRILKRWLDPLLLTEWEIRLAFSEGAFVSPDGAPSEDAVATCHVMWQYRRATITFNLGCVAEQDDEELELTVVHEAAHVLINEMRDDREGELDHEERVASTLARAFLFTYEAGKRAKK